MVNSFFRQLALKSTPFSLLGQCILCADPAQTDLDLCSSCCAELPLLNHACQRCALPLTTPSEPLCGECLQSPPPFSRCHASWLFHPPIAQLISGFKYNRQLSYGHTLAKISSKYIVSAYNTQPLPDLIIPTPMHWLRHLRRGHNHSELLAQHYAKHLRLPLTHAVKRSKPTPPQQTLNAQQRKQNLRGAFSVSNQVKDKRIALVDDVMTTGATATEISRCLLRAGASEVHIWCLARTPH